MFFQNMRFTVLDECRNKSGDMFSLVKLETGSPNPSYNIIQSKLYKPNETLFTDERSYIVTELFKWDEKSIVEKSFEEIKKRIKDEKSS